MSNLLKKEKGFTLIEIVLVLAIAGLLLVIIFIALQGAQRSRRDSQRKTSNASILSQLENFASNNAGAYPSTGAQKSQFNSTYINNIKTPNGVAYTVGTWSGAYGGTSPTLATDAVRVYISGSNVTSCMGLEAGVSCLSNN